MTSRRPFRVWSIDLTASEYLVIAERSVQRRLRGTPAAWRAVWLTGALLLGVVGAMAGEVQSMEARR